MLELVEYHLPFYAVAMILCMTNLFFTLIGKRYDRPQNRLYMMMNVIVMLNSLSGLVCSVTAFYEASNTAHLLTEIFQFLYFFFHPMLAAVFFFYAMTVTGAIYSIRKRKLIGAYLPIVIMEFFVLLNPFFHWVYYYDDEQAFHRGWAETILYIGAAVYFLATVRELLNAWKGLTKSKRNSLLYFVVFTIVGVGLQAVNINIKSELFAEAFALLGIMLAVESEDERLYADVGFYNRKALQLDLENYFATDQKFYAICIKVQNSEMIRRITGSSNTDIMSDILSGYLKNILARYYIYYPNPETFFLTVMEDDEEFALGIADKLSKRFQESWVHNGIEFMLHATIMMVYIPKEIHSVEDMFFMIDRPAPDFSTPNPHMGDELNYLVHRLEIEKAIQNALTSKGFEVYYQPTFHIDGMIHGAEALVRLNAPQLGFISPEEFIPIAEQMGVIDDIDDYVLDCVCDFLHSGIPMANGMESINVNLSVIQCMRPGFVQKILKIVEGHKVDKEMINFEITESVAASDYKILSGVIKELKGSGFMFSMDDYGTGYSNMSAMFSLDFDIVKIDNSILWGAFESRQGMVILEKSVDMIRSMGQKILVEGVETAEQADLLKRLGVDFLQGFYFSKPLQKGDFIAFIQNRTIEMLG